MNPSFGVFAGTLYDAATVTNVTINGTLQISSAAKMTMEGMTDYSIGLLCGLRMTAEGAEAHVITYDISAEAVDENGEPTELVEIAVDEDETVTVLFKD